MKTARVIFMALAPVLFAGGSSFAAGEGTSSGVFLTLPADPVTAAFGGMGAAAGAGPSALHNNPAALAGVKELSGELSHSSWLEGINYSVVSAAMPLRAGGVAAFGIRYLGYGEINALDSTGAPAGGITPRDLAVSAGWARELGDGWSAGAVGKYIDSRIVVSASAFALDGGLQYKAGKLTLGAAFENLGGKLKYNKAAYPLPFTFKAGGAYAPGPGWKFLAGGELPRSGSPRLGAGVQRAFRLSGGIELSARGGYTTRYARTGGLNGISGGAGVAVKDFAFDYAVSSMGELGLTHHFGIGLRWGGADAADEEAEGASMGVLFLN
jgi:hypothetical protein